MYTHTHTCSPANRKRHFDNVTVQVIQDAKLTIILEQGCAGTPDRLSEVFK